MFVKMKTACVTCPLEFVRGSIRPPIGAKKARKTCDIASIRKTRSVGAFTSGSLELTIETGAGESAGVGEGASTGVSSTNTSASADDFFDDLARDLAGDFESDSIACATFFRGMTGMIGVASLKCQHFFRFKHVVADKQREVLLSRHKIFLPDCIA
jgi:hypothetical protein